MSAAAGEPETPGASFRACSYCGLPAGAGAEEEEAFCCFGCRLAQEIWGASQEEGSLASGILARTMLAILFAMASMVFSVALYSSALFPPEAGSSHALGPLTPVFQWLAIFFATPVLLLLGVPLLLFSVTHFELRQGAGPVNVLVLSGVLAAYGLSIVNLLRGSGEIYIETVVMVLVLVTLGRYLEARARSHATRSVRELLSIDVDEACLLTDSRTPRRVSTGELEPGDTILVRAGERVAVDGEVLEGQGALDEAFLTGESRPRPVNLGMGAHAGSLLVDGCIVVKALRVRGQRRLDRLVTLTRSLRLERMPLERLSDTLVRAFLPLLALLTAGTFVFWQSRIGWGEAVLRSLSLLLIACPCALGIATPLATFVAMGRAARRGVLVYGAEVFETLNRGGKVFFDKTGTLTSNRLEVVGIHPGEGVDPGEAVAVAASLAVTARHPVAEAIARYAGGPAVIPATIAGLENCPGRGVRGELAGRSVVLGSRRFLEECSIPMPRDSRSKRPEATRVHVAASGQLLGTIELREEVRPEASRVIGALAKYGFSAQVLTGDSSRNSERLAAWLGLSVEAGLLPEEKAARVRAARASAARASSTQGHAARGRKTSVVMVGDGLNDAPVLASADVGIAVAGGVDLTQEVADVVLLGEDFRRDEDRCPLDGLTHLLEISRETVQRIRFNLFWAFSYNVIGMGLAASGSIHPVLAAILMVVSSLFVVANSVRPSSCDSPGIRLDRLEAVGARGKTSEAAYGNVS